MKTCPLIITHLCSKQVLQEIFKTCGLMMTGLGDGGVGDGGDGGVRLPSSPSCKHAPSKSLASTPTASVTNFQLFTCDKKDKGLERKWLGRQECVHGECLQCLHYKGSVYTGVCTRDCLHCRDCAALAGVCVPPPRARPHTHTATPVRAHARGVSACRQHTHTHARPHAHTHTGRWTGVAWTDSKVLTANKQTHHSLTHTHTLQENTK